MKEFVKSPSLTYFMKLATVRGATESNNSMSIFPSDVSMRTTVPASDAPMGARNNDTRKKRLIDIGVLISVVAEERIDGYRHLFAPPEQVGGARGRVDRGKRHR